MHAISQTISVSLLLCGLVVATPISVAQSSKLDLSGFATLGASWTDNSELGYQSDLTVRDGAYSDRVSFTSLSVAGLQARYHWSEQLSFVAQGVLRPANSVTDIDSLRIASLNYAWTPNTQVRIGRFVPSLYNETDSRYVGYSRAAVTANQEFYGAVPLPFVDGIDLSHTKALTTGLLGINFWYGQSEFEVFYPFNDEPFTFDLNQFGGLSLSWQYDNISIRSSYVQGNQRRAAPIAAAGIEVADQLIALNTPGAVQVRSALSNTQGPFRYGSLGIHYDNGSWSLQSELGQFSSDSIVSPDNRSAYATVARTFDRWTLFGSLGSIRSDTSGLELGPPQYFADFELLTGESIADINAQVDLFNRSLAAGYDQFGASFGAKLWLSKQVALKAQYDYKRLDLRLSNLWEQARRLEQLSTNRFNRQAESGDEEINVLHLTVDVIF